MADKEFFSLETMNEPFSFEAEQAVIGSILIDPECVSDVISILTPEYFYIPQNRSIAETIFALEAMNEKVDALIILEKLKNNGVFDEAGGKNYLAQLAQSVPTSANVKNYCTIVKEKYFLRQLISVSRETITNATSGDAHADKILDTAEQRIYDIRKGKGSQELKKLNDIIGGEVIPTLTKLASDDADEYKGIPTGFSKIDELISGLNRSDLILIGARPAMGKTSFALNMATNVGMKGKKVVFFSLEMSNEQLASRVLSSEARVSSHKLRSGNINESEWQMLAQAMDLLKNCELYFDDTSNITVPEMKSKIRRARNVDCVFIDYLGLMQSPKKTENKVQEISEITRSLKLMAKDLQIPIVVCCQLSRGPEKNGQSTKRPMLSDLRDSGSIEQDADIVMLLYREGYYTTNKTDDEIQQMNMSEADIDIAKNRHGPTDRVKLHWDSEFTRFTTPAITNDDHDY